MKNVQLKADWLKKPHGYAYPSTYIAGLIQVQYRQTLPGVMFEAFVESTLF